ncbi:hypothetical protein Ciccas_011059 [Cichlidogyrus casuarinus]|uniref:Uncharacterized protein n=1 Tax=Cichlidogyrus casuarinus TaxID=1844966 RepID=A0ABD2PSC7_9PLAT
MTSNVYMQNQLFGFLTDAIVSVAKYILAETKEGEPRWSESVLDRVRQVLALYSLRLMQLLALVLTRTSEPPEVELPSFSVLFYLAVQALVTPFQPPEKSNYTELHFRNHAFCVLVDCVTAFLGQTEHLNKVHSYMIWSIGRTLNEETYESVNCKKQNRLFLQLTSVINEFCAKTLLAVPCFDEADLFFSSIPIDLTSPQFPKVCPLWLISRLAMVLAESEEPQVLQALCALFSSASVRDRDSWDPECGCRLVVYQPLIQHFRPIVRALNSGTVDHLLEPVFHWLNALAALMVSQGRDFGLSSFEQNAMFFDYFETCSNAIDSLDAQLLHLYIADQLKNL